MRTEEKNRQVVGTYGRTFWISDSIGTTLLLVAENNRLALVKRYFLLPRRCTSSVFNAIASRPPNRKRVDITIILQAYRQVRAITAHLQPSISPDSDQNIVYATV